VGGVQNNFPHLVGQLAGGLAWGGGEGSVGWVNREGGNDPLMGRVLNADGSRGGEGGGGGGCSGRRWCHGG